VPPPCAIFSDLQFVFEPQLGLETAKAAHGEPFLIVKPGAEQVERERRRRIRRVRAVFVRARRCQLTAGTELKLRTQSLKLPKRQPRQRVV
jgi:hypothetical protein